MWWAWAAVAWATPEEAVEKLLAAGEIEKAEKRCEEVNASAPATLRTLCAEACLPTAERLNTVSGWQTWLGRFSGTPYTERARAGEAGAALAAAGDTASETDYRALWNRYLDTPVAGALRERMGAAAVRDTYDPVRARDVALEYPEHPALIGLVARFPDAFLSARVVDGVLAAVVDPPVGLPADAVQAGWAWRGSDGALVAHGDAVRAALASLPPNAIPAGEPPPCPLTGAPGTLGARVTYGEIVLFQPLPGEAHCGPRPPSFLTVADGQVSGLALAPGHRIGLAPARVATDRAYPWTDGLGAAAIYAPAPAAAPVLAGTLIGQAVGPHHLITPIAGGMPWWVADPPPPNALAIAAQAASAPLPTGWTLDAAGTVSGPAADGSTTAPGHAGWALGPGDHRVIDPLYAHWIGLDADHPALGRRRASPLPAADAFTRTGQLAGPAGAAPLALDPVPVAEAAAASPLLAAWGAAPERAWRVSLGPDGPQWVLDAVLADKRRLRVLIDAVGRTWAWVAPAKASASDPVFGFRWQDRAYVAWVSQAAGAAVDAVHYEDIGLVRELR
jgi:hypothetical protein